MMFVTVLNCKLKCGNTGHVSVCERGTSVKLHNTVADLMTVHCLP